MSDQERKTLRTVLLDHLKREAKIDQLSEQLTEKRSALKDSFNSLNGMVGFGDSVVVRLGKRTIVLARPSGGSLQISEAAVA